MTAHPFDPDTSTTTLPNGVRIVVMRMPHLDSASVSVFVRTGSRDESPRLNGISHVVEHMAFKGTHDRDCQQINLDAERLGAEVNAHTDKDHTAFHMRGLARDAEAFIRMLADIVQNSSFPEAELERERQVLLQEYIEDEDDPLSTAYRLFDKACFGAHAMAQPVIGSRKVIERVTQADLRSHVERHYTGGNVIVGVAGAIDPDAMVDAVRASFGAMPPGAGTAPTPPTYLGGAKSRRLVGSSQSHLVLGFPIPPLPADDAAATVAAALFGEGMSSPLLAEIRERRGLVYHASCTADVLDSCGQFVIEASTTPDHLDEVLTEVSKLLQSHAEATDAVGLARARNQIAVRGLHTQERPFRRLEDAAQDLFVFGRIRPWAELSARIEAVGAGRVRSAFERMLSSKPSLAVTGKIGKSAQERLLEIDRTGVLLR